MITSETFVNRDLLGRLRIKNLMDAPNLSDPDAINTYKWEYAAGFGKPSLSGQVQHCSSDGALTLLAKVWHLIAWGDKQRVPPC